jgi:hypothetical protein
LLLFWIILLARLSVAHSLAETGRSALVIVFETNGGFIRRWVAERGKRKWDDATEQNYAIEVWKPHFQRQHGTKHWSSAESHPPMTWPDTKWNPFISIWYKRSAEISGFVRPTIIRTQFCEGDESRERCPTPGLLKLRGLRVAVMSLIAIEDFVIAEEFGQIYSLSNLWQPRIRNVNVKIGNQISHKSSMFPLTFAWVRQDWEIWSVLL